MVPSVFITTVCPVFCDPDWTYHTALPTTCHVMPTELKQITPNVYFLCRTLLGAYWWMWSLRKLASCEDVATMSFMRFLKGPTFLACLNIYIVVLFSWAHWEMEDEYLQKSIFQQVYLRTLNRCLFPEIPKLIIDIWGCIILCCAGLSYVRQNI